MNRDSAVYKNYFGLEIYQGELVSHKFPWHFHSQYTIIMVDRGGMRYHFKDQVLEVGEKQVLVINPFEPHYNEPHQNGCSYKAIFLPTALFSKPASSHCLTFEKSAADNSTFFNAVQELFCEIETLDNIEARNSLLAKASQLFQMYLPYYSQKNTANYRVLPALDYITKNLHKKILVSELASVCCLSLFHFQRIFRQAIGLTVTSYIHQEKLELGKRLLAEGKEVATTAVETGYFDQSHFHKTFKRMYVAKPTHFYK